MRSLSLYLSLVILGRLVIVIAALGTLMLIPDVIGQAARLFDDPQPLRSLGLYVLIRLPLIVIDSFFLAVYAAAFLAFSDLKYHRELIALFSLGLSPSRLIVALAPLAILLGFFHFFAQNNVMASLLDAGERWRLPEIDISSYDDRLGIDDALWFKSGDDLVRAEGFESDRGELVSWRDIVVFRRREGVLIEQIAAARAVPTPQGWRLDDVVVYNPGSPAPQFHRSLLHDGDLRRPVDRLDDPPPEAMSLSVLNRRIAQEEPDFFPVHHHRVALADRLAAPIAPLLAFAFIASLMGRHAQTDHRRFGPVHLWGIGFGFSYFIVADILRSLAEAGLISAPLSVALPLSAFVAAALWLGAPIRRSARRCD